MADPFAPSPTSPTSPPNALTTGVATLTHPTAAAGAAAILAAATPVLFAACGSGPMPEGVWGWAAFGLTVASGLVAVLRPKAATS